MPTNAQLHLEDATEPIVDVRVHRLEYLDALNQRFLFTLGLASTDLSIEPAQVLRMRAVVDPEVVLAVGCRRFGGAPLSQGLRMASLRTRQSCDRRRGCSIAPRPPRAPGRDRAGGQHRDAGCAVRRRNRAHMHDQLCDGAGDLLFIARSFAHRARPGAGHDRCDHLARRRNRARRRRTACRRPALPGDLRAERSAQYEEPIVRPRVPATGAVFEIVNRYKGAGPA